MTLPEKSLGGEKKKNPLVPKHSESSEVTHWYDSYVRNQLKFCNESELFKMGEDKLLSDGGERGGILILRAGDLELTEMSVCRPHLWSPPLERMPLLFKKFVLQINAVVGRTGVCSG